MGIEQQGQTLTAHLGISNHEEGVALLVRKGVIGTPVCNWALEVICTIQTLLGSCLCRPALPTARQVGTEAVLVL